MLDTRTNAVISRVFKFVLEFAGWRWSTRLLFVIILSSILDLVGIAVIFPYLRVVTDSQAQDTLMARLPSYFSQSFTEKFLLWISCLLLLIYILKSLFQIILMRYQSQQLALLTTRFTDDIVGHLLHVRYDLFLKLAGSEVGATVFSSPIHATLICKALLQIVSELTFIIALFTAFLVVSPLSTLVALALLGAVGVFLYLFVISHTALLGKRQSEAEKTRYRLIFSMVNAFREIKVMGLASLFDAFNREVSSELESVAWRYNFNHSLPLAIIEAAVLMSVVAAVMAVVVAEINISKILPAFGLVALAAVRLVPAVARLFMALNSLRFYSESVKRFQAMRSELIGGQHVREADNLSFTHDIKLEGVSFSHGDKRILEDISLYIEAGKSYGIVGPSGSGKSTLLDVLAGLQPAEAGKFLCDGKPFEPYASGSIVHLIGYVPQDITLIDASLAFNITFEHQPDSMRLEAAIRMANLQKLVNSFAAGCNESVGENGSRLSGGQRQRVGLARALYREPKILVLDEATSALDPITEREISRELYALRGSLTMLTVSHRIAAVQDCDEILVLCQGRIVGRGNHDALLAECALYNDLYLSQQYSFAGVVTS